ncbi:MAG: hypothetical protein KUG73_08515 [Pseudomonadales bacterium]|nr:hypothetical protein [Pseudomonadales bacterium]
MVENSFKLFNSRFNRATSKHKQYASRYEDRSDERRRERIQQQKASSAAMHKAIMGSLNAVNNSPYSSSSTPKANNYSSSEYTTKQAGRAASSSSNPNAAPKHYAYVKAYKRSNNGPQSMYVSSVFQTTMDDVRKNQTKWKNSFIRHVAADSAAVHSFDKRARLISDIDRAQTAFDSHLRNLQRELDVSAKFVRVNWRP